MDHLEFFRYHNRFIEFTYRGKPKKGVVLDVIPYSEKRNDTDYAFISYENLEKWRHGSSQEKKQLQERVDIKEIYSATLIGFQPA